ncbi:succinylglutamate desuccinylase/aspartoacylase family protein [Marinicella sp. S1101]|uniref:succinylglutamate desuccinylase/aspartoacylase family protein n=1 Tax=Marinicella marina TaxID=2996016 RepID=UPI002260CDE6|nr:succinylglutamate desuccinylase/aspartoacylase family protein [Marinicella marina]MCX7553398.1 succinylglutamate desuccinylase/aspartoacylase family protein [Marinicella marina]MDJ1140021.1 succinylglutamate desuccinylase/aspartoacylase family protein [Marinicella marina]
MTKTKEDPIIIGGTAINPGESREIHLPTLKLYTDTTMNIPIYVKRGKKPGPTIFISAAIHGDELNGVEIISRLIKSKSINTLKGTLIAVPMVNGFGVLNQSRYLPDRRDLNRSFPGSAKGSLAGRMAHLFMQEIVSLCDFGIDLHTGAIHRSNLPQIRANIDDETTFAMAKAFGVPVIINSNLRDGSLREAADELGIPMLLYEAGQALRFDELSISVGLKGIINVLRHLKMLPKSRSKKLPIEPFVAYKSSWVRAADSGFVLHKAELGDRVSEGEVLALVKTPLGEISSEVKSHADGIVIGKQNIPLVQEGEAVYHIAFFNKPKKVEASIETMQDRFELE